MTKRKPRRTVELSLDGCMTRLLENSPFMEGGVALEGLMSNLSASGECLDPFGDGRVVDPRRAAAMARQADNEKKANLEWLEAMGTLVANAPIKQLEEITLQRMGYLIEHLAGQAIRMDFIQRQCEVHVTPAAVARRGKVAL